FAAEGSKLSVHHFSLSEKNAAHAVTEDFDLSGLSSNLESLDEVDNTHVEQASREARLAGFVQAFFRPAQEHLDAGDDLLDVAWTYEEVIASGAHSLHPGLYRLVVHHQDEGDGLEALIGLERAAELMPIHAWELGVGQHQVRSADLDLLPRVLSVN